MKTEKSLLQKIDCTGFPYCSPKFNDSPCKRIRRTHAGIFRSDSIVSRIIGNTGAICLELITSPYLFTYDVIHMLLLHDRKIH